MNIVCAKEPSPENKEGQAGRTDVGRLLMEAKRGSAQAFSDLYLIYAPKIFRYVFFRVNHRQEAEDLAGDVFVKAWENLPRFKFKSNRAFTAWLYTIARNRLIDFRRTSKQHTRLDEHDLRSDQSDPVLEIERTQIVREAIARLPDNYQEIIILRFMEGWTVKELAPFLKKGEGALRVLQHRALRRLREILGQEEVI